MQEGNRIQALSNRNERLQRSEKFVVGMRHPCIYTSRNEYSFVNGSGSNFEWAPVISTESNSKKSPKHVQGMLELSTDAIGDSQAIGYVIIFEKVNHYQMLHFWKPSSKILIQLSTITLQWSLENIPSPQVLLRMRSLNTVTWRICSEPFHGYFLGFAFSWLQPHCNILRVNHKMKSYIKHSYSKHLSPIVQQKHKDVIYLQLQSSRQCNLCIFLLSWN